VNGNHVKDSNGTVGFVLALFYNTIYLRDNSGNAIEEDTGKDYTSE
jgi:hypothetical protein